MAGPVTSNVGDNTVTFNPAPAGDNPVGMVWIPGGTTIIGSDKHYPEERPTLEVVVEGFWMDETPVTNAQFAEFVEATGYVTTAEVQPEPEDYPNAPKQNLVAGSAVFVQPKVPVDLSRPTWWQYVAGANWRNPQGSETGKAPASLPVVHITYEDATEYARWAAKQLPSEEQWEFAARGGLSGAEFVWGDELTPDNKRRANYWEGDFPWDNRKPDPPGPTPAGTFEPNGYGLYDMCGSVWEWTTTPWQLNHRQLNSWEPNQAADSSATRPAASCCPPSSETASPATASQAANLDATKQPDTVRQASSPAIKTIKGGSFLCSENYCSRYRPAARFPQSADTSTNHLGFRCIRT